MRARGPLGADIEVRVPFYDVDSIHVVWHGHYVKYLEEARCALLEHIGHDYAAMQDSGYVWPVIDVRLRYVQAARLGQRLRVRAELIEWESRLKVNYLVSCLASGQRLSRATTVQVAVCMQTGEMQLQSPPALVQAVQRSLRALEGAA